MRSDRLELTEHFTRAQHREEDLVAVGRHQRYLDPSRADHEEGVGVVALDDDRRAEAVVRPPRAGPAQSSASSIAMKLFGPTAVSEPETGRG